MAGPLDPALHCFREDGCTAHGPYPPDAPNLCCCCGQSPEVHTGCDCEPTEADMQAGMAGQVRALLPPGIVKCAHCGGAFLADDLATLRANGYHAED